MNPSGHTAREKKPPTRTGLAANADKPSLNKISISRIWIKSNSLAGQTGDISLSTMRKSHCRKAGVTGGEEKCKSLPGCPPADAIHDRKNGLPAFKSGNQPLRIRNGWDYIKQINGYKFIQIDKLKLYQI
jgi:hypothetical protein